MIDLETERKKLTEYLSGFAAINPAVKESFASVRRENFMPKNVKRFAYRDDAVPIGFGQTISQPSTIAIMLELLDAGKGMRVLEVGSGSGYVLALLSGIVGKNGRVVGVEIVEDLAGVSRENLSKEGVMNAEVVFGDGPDAAPEEDFDRILVSCACPFIPKKLFDRLREGGRIVAPVGDEGTQVMEIMEKRNGKPVKKSYEKSLFVFVPMKGKHGYRSNL